MSTSDWIDVSDEWVDVGQNKQQTTLPGLDRTKGIISDRKDIINDMRAKGEIGGSSMPGMIGGATPMKSSLMTILGAMQRGEAAIANPLLNLQEAGVTGSDINPGKSILEGLKGENLGQFGDLIRTQSEKGGLLNEVQAGAFGLGTSAGLSELANARVVSGAINGFKNKVIPAFKSTLMKGAKKDAPQFFYDKAKVAKEGLDSVRDALWNEIDGVYQKIGNDNVKSPELVAEALDDLPPAVKNKVIKLVGKGSKKVGEESATPFVDWTYNQVHQMRKYIDKFAKWGSDGSVDQSLIKMGREKLKNVLAEGNEFLQKANTNYHEFMDLYDNVVGILVDKATGQIKSSGLQGLYKVGADRGKQITFESVNQILPKATQVLDDVKSFTKAMQFREAAGWAGKVGVPLAAGAGLLNQFIGKPIKRAFGKG